MPNPKRRHSKTRTAKRRTHDALEADRPQRVSAVPRGQAAASGLPELRLLPRTPGQGGRGVRSSLATGRRRRPDNRHLTCASPSTPWAATPGRPSSSMARWSPLGTCRSALLLVGDAAAIEGELARHPVASAVPPHRRPDHRRARARRDVGERRAGAAAQAARLDPRRRRSGARRPRRRAVQRRPHRRVGDGGARRVRPAARRRPSRARPRSSPRARAPAVLLDAGATVGCRPPHLVQFAVMGSAYARVALGLRAPARRPAVGRRGGEQGQRADARGASAAQGRADQLHRQRRRARRLRRRRRRHRLRRLHRQRHAEGQRRAGRDRRERCCTTSWRDVRRTRRIRCCRGRRSAGSGAASIIPSTAARRSSASTASASSGTAGRRPRRWPTP